jgi:hypothetical protein
MRNLLYVGIVFAGLAVGAVSSPRVGWSMGTPPFDAELRSGFSRSTKELLDTNKCLRLTDSVKVVSTYRNLRTRRPIAGKNLTVTVSFPARDSKGSRIITVSFQGTTDSDGGAFVSIPLSEALAEAKRMLREDKFYRGVRRVGGPLAVTFTTEDTLERSVRYVPAMGLKFRLCRASASRN